MYSCIKVWSWSLLITYKLSTFDLWYYYYYVLSFTECDVIIISAESKLFRSDGDLLLSTHRSPQERTRRRPYFLQTLTHRSWVTSSGLKRLLAAGSRATSFVVVVVVVVVDAVVVFVVVVVVVVVIEMAIGVLRWFITFAIQFEPPRLCPLWGSQR